MEHVVPSCALHFIPKVKVGTLRKKEFMFGWSRCGNPGKRWPGHALIAQPVTSVVPRGTFHPLL